MLYPVDSSSIFPSVTPSDTMAKRLVRTVEDGEFSMEPEKTAEEEQLDTSFISSPKQLTPEEEQRVLYLRNLLTQILSMVDDQPTDEQRTRIREIEQELEKLTGIKQRSALTKMSARMPKTKDEDEKEEIKQYQLRGIDPKETVHGAIEPESTTGEGLMQFIRKNALQSYQGTSLISSSGILGSLKA